MDTSIIVAVVAGVPAVSAAAFAYRASTSASRVTMEANAIAKSKVDGEVFERSQAFYEKLVSGAEREQTRLQEQISRLREQIEKNGVAFEVEQNINHDLRVQIRDLQFKVSGFEHDLAEINKRIAKGAAGSSSLKPPPTPTQDT